MPSSSGMRLQDRQLIPAHVRNFQRGIVGRDLHHFARDPAQPGMIAELPPTVASNCMPTQMPRNGAPRLQHFFAQRLDHAGHGGKARACNRQRRRRRAARCARRRARSAGSAVVTISMPVPLGGARQRLRRRGEIAGAIIDQGDCAA